MSEGKRSGFVRACKWYVLVILVLTMVRGCFVSTVDPGHVGVRYNNALGLLEDDLGPGWHMETLGLQRIWHLPSRYLFLNYTSENALNIRTKDNNTVTVDISVPYRIREGEAFEVMRAGNHVQDGAGRFRFERLASDTTVGVLREHLAQLQSSDFYNTDRRLEVAAETLSILNEQLAQLHLEATQVLIRASYFRSEYEQQLAQIQLNEQNKLLDGARKLVADKQQTLDNYVQRTNALAAAKRQEWERRIANLDRAFQVGFVDMGDDQTPGAARRKLLALGEEEKAVIAKSASEMFAIELENVTDEHLLGIKNIQAETSEYSQRVVAEANGISARLAAEGEAMVARVNGNYESKINRLLDSPAGRAFVAWEAAEHVTFDDRLTFQSSDGIPSVLRLRAFAKQFMGK